jgi:hypothetical protein
MFAGRRSQGTAMLLYSHNKTLQIGTRWRG